MIAAPAHPERLTRREREIMHAIFALGNRASAEAIRARMPHPPGDSAVRITLGRLEEKGHVRHEKQGPRFVYSATTAPGVAKRRALRQVVDTFFGSSAPHLARSLVAEGSWSEEDLEALRAEINRRQAERKAKP